MVKGCEFVICFKCEHPYFRKECTAFRNSRIKTRVLLCKACSQDLQVRGEEVFLRTTLKGEDHG